MTKTIERPGLILPSIEDITRRDFLIGGAGLLTLGLAGCGRGETGESSGETRTVDGPAGPVEVPVNPRRVIPGYTTDIDVALVLDLPLVGAPGARGFASQGFASYQPEEEPDNVERITTYPEANLEQIAVLQPDCIVDSVPFEFGGDERYELFSEITPTFNVGEAQMSGWEPYLRAVAGAFARETLAERFIAEYEERVVELEERVSQRWSGASFALIGVPESGTVVVMDRQTHPARILENDLGLKPADVMPETQEDRPNLSLERLDLLEDVGLLFVRVEPEQEGSGRDRSILDPIQDSPLWQRLPAIRKGQVVEYDAELFYASPLTAEAFLDVVESSLLA